MRATIEPISWLGLPRMSCEASGSSSIRSSSIARRSAGATGVANGSSPASSASSCSTCAQKPWTVVTVISSKPPSRPLSSRSRSASAPACETVRVRIDSGARPCSRTSQAKRSHRAVVLPVPAPPRISSGPPGWVTASSWAGVGDTTVG